MISKFSLKEMIYISLLATIATVSKLPIRTLSNFLTSTIGLPGGVVGGIYYMFWIVAACALVRKKGTATLFCIVQIFVTLATSSMPVIKLITYLPPGLAIDIFMMAVGHDKYNVIIMMILGALANSVGSISMSLIMQLPLAAALVGVLSSAISGAIGGYVAYLVVVRIKNAVFQTS